MARRTFGGAIRTVALTAALGLSIGLAALPGGVEARNSGSQPVTTSVDYWSVCAMWTGTYMTLLVNNNYSPMQINEAKYHMDKSCSLATHPPSLPVS